jgi:hypothetical protein
LSRLRQEGYDDAQKLFWLFQHGGMARIEEFDVVVRDAANRLSVA